MARMTYDIRDFGASSGEENNARHIQAAIDACALAGGGLVSVEGGQYATGTVELHDHVTLWIERGSSLLGSQRFEDYPHGDGLIYASGAHDIAISGGGAIYGRLPGAKSPFPHPADPLGRRPRILCLNYCKGVDVEGVSLLHPSNWCSVFVMCEDVRISGVRIDSTDIGNGDGLDFNGSRRVVISDCLIDAGDDAISLKSYGPEYMVEDFAISNCILRSHWAGIRIGVEGDGDMRNIVMSNCVMRDCGDGLKIQNAGNSVFERMQFSNIVMDNVARPFFITLSTYPFARKGKGMTRPPVGKLRDLTLRDIAAVYDRTKDRGHHDTRSAAAILGLPGHPVENVKLYNISLTLPGGCERFDEWDVLSPELLDGIDIWPELFHLQGKVPASGLMARHVDGLTLRDCRLDTFARDEKPMLFFDDVRKLRLSDIEGGLNNRHACMALDADPEDMAGIPWIAPSAALLQAHAARRAEDVAWQHTLFEHGAAADRAHRLPVAVSFSREEMADARFAVESGEGEVYAYLPMARGEVSIVVNGHTTYRRVPPDYARGWRYYWAVDISGALNPGENRIEVAFVGANAGFLPGGPAAFEPTVWQLADHYESTFLQETPALELRTGRAVRHSP